MSIRLRELIRAVRACKTAAEERDVIARESAALREAFREQDPRYRHRNVAKLMYIHMLGYPTHFGQMETLKLIAANGFPEKRIGYLGLMLLLDERQEVLMLVTNSLKMDLNNTKNQYIVGLALAALGNICSAEMARDLAPDVERLLESSNPYVRKKAALCAIRVLKKNPELVEVFYERAADLIHDRNQGVQLSGVTLMLAICSLDPEVVVKYRPIVPGLCKVLRGLLQGGFSPEHDVSGITNPFLQVRVLQLLQVLGHGDADASDRMTDILAQVAANIDGTRNAGNAILYEAVNTIMGIETVGGLRVMAVNILGRFLANRDNNIRYVALNTLAKVVAVDTAAVQRHRATIVECVRDADVSIRRRALELVYSLVNEGNIKNLTRELLDYLSVCDTEFKPDLTAKVCALIQRFAPNKRWHIDSMLAVLQQAGAQVKDEPVRSLLVLVANAPELHAYAARAMARALGGPSWPSGGVSAAALAAAGEPLQVAALWTIGEFGEALPTAAGQPLLEGEAALGVSGGEVVSLVEAALTQPKAPHAVREVALTALMKLTARLPDQVARCTDLVCRHSTSVLLEVQQRACEYGRILQHDAIRAQLLERMPALDEAEYWKALGLGAPPPAGVAPSTGGADAAAAGGGGGVSGVSGGGGADDLVDLLGGADAAAAAVTSASQAGAAALDDLLGPGLGDGLGGLGALGGLGGPSPSAGGGADILDLLGPSPTPAPAPVATPPLAVAAAHPDPLADLLGGAAPAALAAPTPAPVAAAASYPPFTAFAKAGISVSFTLSKPQPASQPGLTEITARTSNNGMDDVVDFTLQAAVPKYMALRLEPASGSSLPALGGGVLTQRLLINNSQHGAKPLVMRLRISYSVGGQQVLEQAEVSNFPPGA